MKQTHETQPSKSFDGTEDQVFSPVEDLQRMEGTSPLNKNAFVNASGLPKGVKVTGYILLGMFGLMILAALLLNVLQ
ncbi:hypothetical protein CEF21_08315 [Bacillus sp. FJAT-42376]|uniref:hypothetical protein n=1 Tax=Bacillus sp. FJAT-42376 TaxID=2014076 RepID=UPI000F4F1BD6|nr:hypothetical protein [Bacillus sp. FJAT-42376]AZB42290.1 hypothetical protein CEF21_08315 [Bacillus sp. FJAT-42376]